MQSILTEAGPERIGAVTVESPISENHSILEDIRSGNITREQFIARAPEGHAERNGAYYDLVKTAQNMNVPFLAADAGDQSPRYKAELTAQDLERRLNDQPTYDYLQNKGLLDTGKTVLAQQGISHMTNARGDLIKGMDDIAEDNGKSVLTISQYHSDQDVAAQKKTMEEDPRFATVVPTNDASDVTFVDTQMDVNKTTAETLNLSEQRLSYTYPEASPESLAVAEPKIPDFFGSATPSTPAPVTPEPARPADKMPNFFKSEAEAAAAIEPLISTCRTFTAHSTPQQNLYKLRLKHRRLAMNPLWQKLQQACEILESLPPETMLIWRTSVLKTRLIRKAERLQVAI